jgi:hypothetical protein
MPSASKPTKYRYIGSHAAVLEGGAAVGPGDYVSIDPANMTGVNQQMLDDGVLIDASGVKEPAASKEEE